ncbi:MAG TPA: Mur ligase family protein [bacterium]|nr:Mur ligase family protein [bacterium]HRQ71198.1 Mur ligase family protein [bacterium]
MNLQGKKILFARICGTGVSSLALICKNAGAIVTGVDLDYYPPVSTKLAEENIPCFAMDKFFELIENDRPDIIVVGNALNGKSAEAKFILEGDIPYYSMPSFMEEFLLDSKKPVVISGTHGKTTTTTIFSELLTGIGADPSYMIGGIPEFSGTNSAFSEGEKYFVIEGDEYDTAFFDKGPKFLHYKPETTIITSIEFDHADIYDSVDAIFNNFVKLVGITKKKVILCLDFEHNRNLTCHIPSEKLFTYSIEDKRADAFIQFEEREGSLMVFSVNFKNGKRYSFKSPMFGMQNLMNLGSLIAFLKCEGFDLKDKKLHEVIGNMKGIKRRQELIGSINGGLVYSDFAHHPTAAKLTLESFLQFFPEKKVSVIFDPATNSNNQNVFEGEYTEIFKAAHKFVLGHPPKLEKFPPELRFSPERVVLGVNSEGVEKAKYIKEVDDVINWLRENSTPETVTVVMSNSGFYGFFTKIIPYLDKESK